MPVNDSYVAAKKEKNDEFYTQYDDIQREINAYLEYNPEVFKGKTVLLPCDDPEWSNFTRFFAQNFENLGIKKLISTSYARNSKKYKGPIQLSLFEIEDEKYDVTKTDICGKIFTLSKDINNSCKIDIDDLEWDYLDGDGDFRSDEIKKLRDEADIIVTNPPFSLFCDFINWIFEANKQFLVIGSIGTITYADIFPLIQKGKMWLGNGFSGDNAYFKIPIDLKEKYKDLYNEKTGLVKFRNCCWFTNIDHGRRHQPIPLMTYEENLRYSRHKDIRLSGYQKYDNYDAIEVNYTDAIPSDYDGIMGVASSFLKNHCPDQFEIIACSQTGCHPDDMVLKTYKDYKGYKQNGTPTGRNGNTCGHNPMLTKNDGVHDYYINADGHIVQSANGRIFIRRIKK